MDNKDQHWVTRSYLKAWIDPSTPPNHKGYVWVFSRDGKTQKNKSPKNIFSEPDFYTKKTDDGSRDLTLEKTLSEIENLFISTKRHKLDSNQDLTPEDLMNIIVFVSVMLNRTKLRRDNENKHWNHLLKMIDEMAESIKKNPSRSFPHTHRSTQGNSLSHEDVRKIAKEPIQSILLTASRATADILMKMNMHILCAPVNSNFITSDHPCVIFDPLNSSKHIALGCQSVEVTFPISPKQMAIFFWGDTTKPPEYTYIKATEEIVDEINRRTRFFCDEHFITNDKVKKDFWFE